MQKPTEIIEIPSLILDSLEDVAAQSSELGALLEAVSFALEHGEVTLESIACDKFYQ